MQLLKQGYALLLTGFYLSLISLGSAQALPQDWTCAKIEVEQTTITMTTPTEFTARYSGLVEDYRLEIDLSGELNSPSSFADCGTAGCLGVITDIKTGYSETLPFYCQSAEPLSYKKATCYIHNDGEYIFSQTTEETYLASLCLTSKTHLILNLKECNNCHCEIFEETSSIKTHASKLACTRIAKDKLRCFSYYAYERWKNFETTIKDYTTCKDLSL